MEKVEVITGICDGWGMYQKFTPRGVNLPSSTCAYANFNIYYLDSRMELYHASILVTSC